MSKTASTESSPPASMPSSAISGPGTNDSTSSVSRSSASADAAAAARAMAPARRHAASRPEGSSARITPRLADSASGFTTQGNSTPASWEPRGRPSSTRLTAGTGSPACRERGAGQILAAGDPGRGRRVVREPEGGGGPVRDLDGAVVGGDDPGDGPVALRGDDPLDDGVGVTEIDAEPVPDAGNQRVLALTRDDHLDAEIARRLQVGVHPVAAGRGDQQDPGRGVPHPLGVRRLPGPRRRQAQPPPPPAMPHAPQVPAPPVAWNTLLNTKVEPVSRVTKSISTPLK